MKTLYYPILLITLTFSIACVNLNEQQDKIKPLSLKIASYNVRNAKGIDEVVDFERTAKVINDMDADAVAIQ